MLILNVLMVKVATSDYRNTIIINSCNIQTTVLQVTNSQAFLTILDYDMYNTL